MTRKKSLKSETTTLEMDMTERVRRANSKHELPPINIGEVLASRSFEKTIECRFEVLRSGTVRFLIVGSEKDRIIAIPVVQREWEGLSEEQAKYSLNRFANDLEDQLVISCQQLAFAAFVAELPINEKTKLRDQLIEATQAFYDSIIEPSRSGRNPTWTTETIKVRLQELTKEKSYSIKGRLAAAFYKKDYNKSSREERKSNLTAFQDLCTNYKVSLAEYLCTS